MADAPQDPFDEDAPLGDDERHALQQDLVDVQVLKQLLEPKGIRGTVFYCPDCGEDHYLGWDLLHGNLRELLDEGESPVHEPAFDPNPEEYVSWDYARGFLDGYESYEDEELSEVAGRLIGELRERGWQVDEIKQFLGAVGLKPSGDRKEKG